MPTHDYIISNGTGAAVRADINSALSAIVSLNSSASEPATMYAYQLWADTTNGLLKIRNSANSAWITLRQLDGDFSIVAVEDGLQATPSLTFTNDLNTGIFRPSNDSLAIVSGGTRSITITSTQAVGIQTANPSAPLHVAGVARVGADDATDAVLEIGAGATGSRNAYLDLIGDTTYTDYGVRFIRNNTGANATSEIKHRGTGNFNITTQEASAIEFSTSNTPRVTITSGGLVGLGTSNPKIDLQTGTSGGIQAANTGEIAIRYNLYNSSGDKYIQAANKAASMVMDATGDVIFYNTNTASTAADSAVTGLTARMAIKASGNVGINTTGPTRSLEVAVGATSNNGILVTGSNSPGIIISETSGSVNLNLVNDASGAYIGTSSNHYLVLRTNNTERARIDSSGRLLVGTTSAAGLVSNIAPVVAGAFKSNSGTVTIAPSTTTTIFTIPASSGEGAYTVTAIYVGSNNVAVFSAYAVILYDGSATNAYRATGFDGSLLSITVSGRDVQLTTGAGYTQSISWSFIRQAVA